MLRKKSGPADKKHADNASLDVSSLLDTYEEKPIVPVEDHMSQQDTRKKAPSGDIQGDPNQEAPLGE